MSTPLQFACVEVGSCMSIAMRRIIIAARDSDATEAKVALRELQDAARILHEALTHEAAE